MSRRRARRPAPPPADPSALPPGFRARMEALLGPETDALLGALLTPDPGLRVNTLRVDPSHYARTAPFPLAPLGWLPEGFLIGDPAARPGLHPHHAAGVYYLQDPGAMAVAALAPLPPNPRVLDLAAAPGGKSTHLGARMAGRGVLVANDIHPKRVQELAGNLERCGIPAVVTSSPVERLAEHWPGWFDLVLLDAPCSGESMFHRSEAARREWSEGMVAGCARRQEELLAGALPLVRPGGILLYSTCTFSPEENEQVVSRFLAAFSHVTLEPLARFPGAESARPEWGGPGAPESISRALRLWPHRMPGAGHFVAAFRVGAGPPGQTPVEASAGGAHLDGPARALLDTFLESAAPDLDLQSDELIRRGDEVYLPSHEAPPLAGVRVIRPGWWIGTLKRGRFEPSHALALVAPGDAFADRLELPADSSEVAAFLRGESLRIAGSDGWVRVEVDGHPLGWGKRSGGVVKNRYPRGLRRG